MYYDSYTSDKIIVFITKTDFFKEYIFSLDLPQTFNKAKIEKAIETYNSDFAPFPYNTLQSVSCIVTGSMGELTFEKTCILIFADICGLSDSQLEKLSNKKLSSKQMEQLLVQMLNQTLK